MMEEWKDGMMEIVERWKSGKREEGNNGKGESWNSGSIG
jgi:hypothetical protein